MRNNNPRNNRFNQRRNDSLTHSPHSSRRLAWHVGQKPRVLQENVNRCSAWQFGQRILATVSVCPHETVTDHEGEARARIAAVEVTLDDLPDDGSEIPVVLFQSERYSHSPLSWQPFYGTYRSFLFLQVHPTEQVLIPRVVVQEIKSKYTYIRHHGIFHLISSLKPFNGFLLIPG